MRESEDGLLIRSLNFNDTGTISYQYRKAIQFLEHDTALCSSLFHCDCQLAGSTKKKYDIPFLSLACM